MNLSYLLERYTLDTVMADWTTVLSVGEQQRLSFVRLLAYFTLTADGEQRIRETLVLFDESTSAVDARTEHAIYERLIRLRVWFVTISHRPSLIQLHNTSLPLYANKDTPQHREESSRPEEPLTALPLGPIADDDDDKQLLEMKDFQVMFTLIFHQCSHLSSDE